MKSSRTTAAWRSSTWLIVFTATLGLFTENFLYGFVVPIMSYMFEKRLGQDPEYTQRYASGMLFVLGAVSVPCAPLIGHLADKTPNRKTPLLISFAGAVIGTVMVAATWSVWSVFVGRLFEGISGTLTWIVCFSMLTDNIDKKHYGKTLGFTSSFVMAGVLTGPAIAGTLLEWAGYWPAWSVPFALLGICLIARLVMIEKKKPGQKKAEPPATEGQDTIPALNEHTALLAAEAIDRPAPTDNNASTAEEHKPSAERNFYIVMLSNASCLTSLTNNAIFTIIVSSFDATLPLHLQRKFGWGPASTGLIFLAIQIPGLVLGPMVGWLRDRCGVRWPAVAGYLLQAPLMWFVGVPGTLLLPGLREKAQQEAAFVGAIISLGIVVPLVRGAGTFQNTIILKEIQDQNPGIFGPNGGSSRLFAMTEVVFNIGLMVGPLIAGGLVEAFGFYWMMFFLAILCLVAAISSAFFLTDQTMAHTKSEDE